MPSPKESDISEIPNDVNQFIRLALHLHFADDNNEENETSKTPEGILKFRPKSKWTPRINNDTFKAFTSNVKRDLLECKIIKKTKDNLTKNERKALNELKRNPNIIIKKADKRSSIVIMDKADYIKGHRQLMDTNFYIETKQDLTPEHSKTIENKLDILLQTNKITEDIHKCLKNKNHKPPSLYLLPKIHKIKSPGTFPAGRPIISANNSPTERISAFVDEDIKAAVPKIKSYFRDTKDFISKIEQLEIPETCILVTFDVVSLYTNIPNHEGMKDVARSLVKFPPKFTDCRTVLELLREVLHKNNFEFNGKHYLQVGGTAMGTR